MGGRGSTSTGRFSQNRVVPVMDATGQPAFFRMEAGQEAGNQAEKRVRPSIQEIKPKLIRDVAGGGGYVYISWPRSSRRYESNGDGTFSYTEQSQVDLEGNRGYTVERKSGTASAAKVLRDIRSSGVASVTVRVGSTGFGTRYTGKVR